MGFCKHLIYAALGSGCSVSRNDESADTLAYILEVVTTHIPFKYLLYYLIISHEEKHFSF